MGKPKDKAIELVNKFSTVGLQQREEGIACAIIAVDEILELLPEIAFGNRVIKFYEQVKEEIQNL
jgi:hypothetical protein